MFDRTLIDTITQYLIILKCTRRCIFLQKKSSKNDICTLLKKKKAGSYSCI